MRRVDALGGPRAIRRLRIGVGVVLGLLVALRILFPTGAVGQGAYLGATVGGAVLAVVGLTGASRHRPWRWVALSVALSALAEILYWAYTTLTDRGVPDVSWADPAWLLSYVALGAGVSGVLGLRGSRAHYRERDAVLDMCTAGIVGLLVLWTLVLQPAVSDGSGSLTSRLVWSSYPILDVALLAALVGGIAVMRRSSPATLLLCCGVACWLASDFGFVLGVTSVPAWMDAGWMAGATLLGLAVWEGRSEPAREDGAPVERTLGRVRVAAGVAPLMVPIGLEIWGFQHGEEVNPWPLALATAALAYLAFVRCTRLVHGKDRVAAELDASGRYYRALATNSSDAVLVVNRQGVILHESPTFARLARLPEPIVGLDVLSLSFIADPDLARELLTAASRVPGELVEAELMVHDPGHGERWFALRVMDMVNDVIGGIVVNVHEVTKRRQMEEELRTQAFHDSLTGLANRALFRDRVGHALESRGRTGVDPAVLFIDLDEFKYINDTLGHDAGDRLLKAVAERLLLAVRPGDTVARLGGDEFAVLIESGDSEADAPGVAERLLEMVPRPLEVAGRTLQISCSVGIARADDRSDTSSLLRHADMAMYEAKERGKGRWALYHPAMGAASRERMDLEGDLHGALEAGQFELVYQPIFEIRSGQLSGFESLLRWKHPVIGAVTPERFIPILEANGHIVEVGAWILGQACRQAAEWMKEHRSGDVAWSMSVNVSSVQVADPGFVATVETVLRETGIDPALLVLEITETSLIGDAATAATRLEALHALGIKLAIDDFGTGYNSLSYLRQFPFDILKVDRSFIQTMTAGQPMPPIIKGLLDLARTLGIETIAEGIDEAHQLSQLKAEHCEKGQGFLFARPLSACDARLLLVTHAGRAGAVRPALASRASRR